MKGSATNKVGDKVKGIDTEYDSSIDEVRMVVARDKKYYPNIGVKFDEWIKGHNLGKHFQFDYGWWFRE